ncbi:MAG TPA: hypothetical protein VH062_05150 [Polyangiaceae bacterium]|jgi:hypothetical protein|nr:hypothetical protein [Polyangiaceae bacterium]
MRVLLNIARLSAYVVAVTAITACSSDATNKPRCTVDRDCQAFGTYASCVQGTCISMALRCTALAGVDGARPESDGGETIAAKYDQMLAAEGAMIQMACDPSCDPGAACAETAPAECPDPIRASRRHDLATGLVTGSIVSGPTIRLDVIP